MLITDEDVAGFLSVKARASWSTSVRVKLVHPSALEKRGIT